MKPNSQILENSGGVVGQVVNPPKKNYEHYHIRLNKFVNSQILSILEKFNISKGNCNLEKGAGGMEHYQMTISIRPKMTERCIVTKMIELFPHLINHLNKQGTADGKEWYCKPSINEGSNRYCMKKDETFVKEIFSIGDILTKNKVSKFIQELNYFFPWQKKILKIMNDVYQDRWLHVFIGGGNTGKTTFCKYLITHYDDVILLSGKSADMKNSIIEYEENNSRLPTTILCNIPKCFNKCYLSYTGIEEVKDMLFYSGKYKGGMVCDKPIRFIIFSNDDLDYNELSPDRWKINYIPEISEDFGLLFGKGY